MPAGLRFPRPPPIPVPSTPTLARQSSLPLPPPGACCNLDASSSNSIGSRALSLSHSLSLSRERSVIDFPHARTTQVFSLFHRSCRLSVHFSEVQPAMRCFIIAKISSLDGSQPRLPAPPAIAVAEHCSRMAMAWLGFVVWSGGQGTWMQDFLFLLIFFFLF